MESQKRPQFGGRHLTEADDVFRHNAWDDVEWGPEQLAAAREKVEANARVSMTADERSRLEEDADKKWDEFYGTHKAGFFKDRNWLFTEFPELLQLAQAEKSAVLEVGCGAGNTVFPLLERLKSSTVFCCDFSPNAVNLVRENKDFAPSRCSPFVLDATKQDWESEELPFAEESLDCVLLIFTMSAMEPAHMKSVARNLHKYLKPGGMVLFRDYGLYDLAQLRFKPGRCIADNFYARGDGTRYAKNRRALNIRLVNRVGLGSDTSFC